jgi:hypothetical protein
MGSGLCLALTPGSDSPCHDRQSHPTGGSRYHLTDDRDDVETIQGWDQKLEDLCADNSAYSSRNRISGGTLSISPTAEPPATPATSQMMRVTVSGINIQFLVHLRICEDQLPAADER